MGEQLKEEYERIFGNFEALVDSALEKAKWNIETMDEYSLENGIELPDYGLDSNTKRK